MANYKDILITSDFDNTLASQYAIIPSRNISAIQLFMDRGGAFTVNTGRSFPLFRPEMEKAPANAPFIISDGSIVYDRQCDEILLLQEIPIKWTQFYRRIREQFPMVWLEFQGIQDHKLCRMNAAWEEFWSKIRVPHSYALPEEELGPFLRCDIYSKMTTPSTQEHGRSSHEEIVPMDNVAQWLTREYGDVVSLLCYPGHIEVHPKSTNKGHRAQWLKQKLQKKILICIGDSENDIPMLDIADFAFCPKGSVLSSRYPTVCNCADGALADLIENVIPTL